MIFYKYQGCGNDFVILDGRAETYALCIDSIRKICDRRFGIGGDGLMILYPSLAHDFSMKYYNSDGRESSFCGNGGRCIVQFAHDLNLIKDTAIFEFNKDTYHATLSSNLVSLQMQPIEEISMDGSDYVLWTGSPHYVHFTTKIDEIDLVAYARKIRYSEKYPDGVNVNLVEMTSDNTIYMRTYERGVEDETYSCGTGVVAAAIALDIKENLHSNEIRARTKGGNFTVQYSKEDAHYKNIKLIGPAEFVFKGEIDILNW
jgi:diaminopimelate epimerase